MPARLLRLAILLAVLAMAAGCAPSAMGPASQATARPATAQALVVTPGVQYQMVPVKTATPRPGAGAAQTVPTPVPATPSSVPATPTTDARAAVPRVGLEEARAQIDAGRAVLVDVRSAGSYQQSHAAGALSLPTSDIADRYRELPRDKLIILYCA